MINEKVKVNFFNLCCGSGSDLEVLISLDPGLQHCFSTVKSVRVCNNNHLAFSANISGKLLNIFYATSLNISQLRPKHLTSH
jgi:hypothetical protein